jgi:hypothetical protein
VKLKISTRTSVLDKNAGDALVRDRARLVVLDGVASDECFSDYLSDDRHTKELPSKGVSGGYLRFRFKADRNELWAETEYDLKEPLTDDDTKSLVDYTLGQWSDGIGENFCPDYAERTGLFLLIEPEHAIVKVS